MSGVLIASKSPSPSNSMASTSASPSCATDGSMVAVTCLKYQLQSPDHYRRQRINLYAQRIGIDTHAFITSHEKKVRIQMIIMRSQFFILRAVRRNCQRTRLVGQNCHSQRTYLYIEPLIFSCPCVYLFISPRKVNPSSARRHYIF